MPLQTKQGIPFQGFDLIRISSSYSPQRKCKALVYVIGGGGSGGGEGATTLTWMGGGTGGGAGGCAISVLTLDPATTYTAVIGAGGSSGTGNPVQGAAGTQTTFSGSGIATMTGNGGGAGAANSSVAGALSVSGGSGGTASGGNFANRTGGSGGNMTLDTIPSGTGTLITSTGGGAVNFLGKDTRGGNIDTNFDAGSGIYRLATGGGGVGGQGGDINDSVSDTTTTAPGGGTSPNLTANSGTSSLNWISGSDNKEDIANPLLFLGSDVTGNTTQNAAYGSGASGRIGNVGGLVRDFGGSGGSADFDSSRFAKYGGGSGGVGAYGAGLKTPGSGGAGIIIVQILEVYL